MPIRRRAGAPAAVPNPSIDKMGVVAWAGFPSGPPTAGSSGPCASRTRGRASGPAGTARPWRSSSAPRLPRWPSARHSTKNRPNGHAPRPSRRNSSRPMPNLPRPRPGRKSWRPRCRAQPVGIARSLVAQPGPETGTGYLLGTQTATVFGRARSTPRMRTSEGMKAAQARGRLRGQAAQAQRHRRSPPRDPLVERGAHGRRA